MPQNDPLSDVLNSVRLQGAIFYYVSFDSEWVAETPASAALANALMPGSEHVIAFHLFVKGKGYAYSPAIETMTLEAGDVVLFPHGDAHTLASKPGMRAVPDDSNWQYLTRHDPRPIPVSYHQGMLRPSGAAPTENDHTVVICGFIGCDVRPYNPLIAALPRALTMSSQEVGGWITPVLNQAAMESHLRQPGSDAVLDRASELLFVGVVRRYLDRLALRPGGDNQTNWLTALNDVHVGRAITLMHGNIVADWTVEELGKQVGLSRSALSERFANLVGIPPMQYLTQWRIQRSATRLRNSTVSVATIAQEFGYESEAAFSRAFNRLVGQPPASWRREQQRTH